MWHDLVHMGISPAEKAVRTVAIYGGLLVLLHLAGKRQLAQLNSFDLVVLLLLSNVVQNAVIGSDNSLAGGLLGAVILVAVNAGVVRGAFMSPRFGKALQGGATLLYADGRFNVAGMRRLAVTREEVVAGLRRQGLELADVERVVLEPEGALNAMPRPKPGIEAVLAKLESIERRLPA